MKSSREFFTSRGEPDPKRMALMEKVGARAKELGGENPRLEKIIAEIDFDLLKSLLQDLAARSGVNPRTINFIGPERIGHRVVHPKAFGEYLPIENIINFSCDNIEEDALDYGLNPDLIFLKLLLHEEIHATSRVECRGLELPRGVYPFRQEIQGGYQKFIESKKTPAGKYKVTNLFELFDEGVVEKLAREVFSEYARRAGKYSPSDIQKLKNFWRERPEETTYGITLSFVEELIFKISREVGIPENVVWQAFIRGLYEGEKFKDRELRRLFAEVISPRFLKILARANTDAKIQTALQELYEPTISPQEKKRILTKWMRNIE